MADDDHEQDSMAVQAAKTSVAAMASSFGVGPAVVVAVLQQAAKAATNDAAVARASLSIFEDILLEGEQERQQQYRGTRDDFDRHQWILRWLQDELAAAYHRLEDADERIRGLEAAALGMLRDNESLLLRRPDPEMRPYLVNAWRNAIQNPKRFSSVWVRRFLDKLEIIGAEHLEMMKHLASSFGREPERDGSVYITVQPDQLDELDREGGLLLSADLEAAELLQRPRRPQNAFRLSHLALRLLEFVSEPEVPTQEGPPSAPGGPC